MRGDVEFENKLLSAAVKEYALENATAFKHLESICNALLDNADIDDVKTMAKSANAFMYQICNIRSNIDMLSDYLSSKN